MGNEERIEELLEQIPYAVEEYNTADLEAIKKDLLKLGHHANEAITAIAEVSRICYDSKNAEETMIDELRTRIDKLTHKAAVEYLKDFRKKYPLSLSAIFIECREKYGKTALRNAFRSQHEYDQTLAIKDYDLRMKTVLGIFAERFLLSKKDYELIYNIYVATGDYSKAREICYKEAVSQEKSKDYYTARKYYLKARDYSDAPQRAKEIKGISDCYEKFKKEFSGKENYVTERVKAEYPSEYNTYMYHMRKYNRAPAGNGFLCMAGLILSFVLTILMHGDPELEKHIIYILFAAGVTVSLHSCFDWDYTFIKSGLIAFISLCLPKLLQLASLSLFSTHIPAFVLLNLITGIPLVLNIINSIRVLIGNKEERTGKKIFKELIEPKKEKIRKEVADRYAPYVGDELAAKWANELY